MSQKTNSSVIRSAGLRGRRQLRPDNIKRDSSLLHTEFSGRAFAKISLIRNNLLQAAGR